MKSPVQSNSYLTEPKIKLLDKYYSILELARQKCLEDKFHFNWCILHGIMNTKANEKNNASLFLAKNLPEFTTCYDKKFRVFGYCFLKKGQFPIRWYKVGKKITLATRFSYAYRVHFWKRNQYLILGKQADTLLAFKVTWNIGKWNIDCNTTNWIIPQWTKKS